MLESSNGYSKLMGKQEDKEFVLRFNSKWFRNNYRIFDLERMDLTYLGIKVGTCTKNELLLENQIPSDTSHEINKESSDLLNKFLEKNDDLKSISQQMVIKEQTKKNNENDVPDKLNIYDVLLAGVSNE